MHGYDLLPDEKVLTRRKPTLRQFGKKVLFIFVVWTAFLTLPGFIFGFSGLLAGLEGAVADWIIATSEYIQDMRFGIVVFALINVIGAGVLALFHMFILDDFGGWLRVRQDRWTITNQRILMYQPNSTEGGELYWNQIQSVHNHFFWSLTLKLSNGQTVIMSYVPKRDALRQLIEDQLDLIANSTPTPSKGTS